MYSDKCLLCIRANNDIKHRRTHSILSYTMVIIHTIYNSSYTEYNVPYNCRINGCTQLFHAWNTWLLIVADCREYIALYT